MRSCLKNPRVYMIIAAVFIFFVGPVRGQEPETKTENSESRFYFMSGVNLIDNDDLNSYLTAREYHQNSDDFLSFGGGCTHLYNNGLIIGGEGSLIFGDEYETTINGSDIKTSLSAIYGILNFGYSLYHNKNMQVYPLVGIGGGSVTFKKAPSSFDEILDGQSVQVNLTAETFLLNTALGFEYRFSGKTKENMNRGLILGIRVGYNFSPSDGDWHSEGIDISGGPNAGLTEPYIRLLIEG